MPLEPLLGSTALYRAYVSWNTSSKLRNPETRQDEMAIEEKKPEAHPLIKLEDSGLGDHHQSKPPDLTPGNAKEDSPPVEVVQP
jgi:hypothetical protein